MATRKLPITAEEKAEGVLSKTIDEDGVITTEVDPYRPGGVFEGAMCGASIDKAKSPK